MRKVKKIVFAAMMSAITLFNSTVSTNAAETPDKAPAGSREAVSGIITDSEHHALPGASILIEDTKTGAMSGIDGINVPYDQG